MTENSPVYITECPDYDENRLTDIIRAAFSAIGVDESLISGKKVLIKRRFPTMPPQHIPP